MTFIPIEQKSLKVPWFHEAVAAGSAGGWRGHTTQKTVAALESEVTAAFGDMGALVTSFQAGAFNLDGRERQGYQIRYVIKTNDNSDIMLPGQVEIAALPIENDPKKARTYKKRRKNALKQALYMFRDALIGLQSLRILSPGTEPILLWLLEPTSGKTISQLWRESGSLLLPPGETKMVEAEWEEITPEATR